MAKFAFIFVAAAVVFLGKLNTFLTNPPTVKGIINVISPHNIRTKSHEYVVLENTEFNHQNKNVLISSHIFLGKYTTSSDTVDKKRKDLAKIW